MHYNFKKGIKVFVKLKDGTEFTAKWHETERKFFKFLDREPIKIKKVRFISINKPRAVLSEIESGRMKK